MIIGYLDPWGKGLERIRAHENQVVYTLVL